MRPTTSQTVPPVREHSPPTNLLLVSRRSRNLPTLEDFRFFGLTGFVTSTELYLPVFKL